MKERKTKGWEQVCESLSPEDGIPPAILARQALSRSNRHKSDHRSWQYCKQVQQAIEGGLACDCGDDRLRGLLVASVEPVSGCAAVLVTVLSREVEIVEINAIQRSLTEASGVLRSAVASGTHRKRVPTLRFRVLPDVS